MSKQLDLFQKEVPKPEVVISDEQFIANKDKPYNWDPALKRVREITFASTVPMREAIHQVAVEFDVDHHDLAKVMNHRSQESKKIAKSIKDRNNHLPQWRLDQIQNEDD
jgi:hypothetical protein